MLGARGPDLLAVDDVVSSPSRARRGAQAERVGAGGRLGDAEGLQAQLAAGDLRQVTLLLLGVPCRSSVPMVYICAWQAPPLQPEAWISSRIAAAAVRVKPAAAVFFRDQRGEKAGLGQRGDEFLRIGALAVERAPVFAGKFRAQRAHRLADVGEFAGRRVCSVTCFTSARPLLMAMTSRSTTRARKLTTSPSRHISVRMVSPGKTGAENRPANAIEPGRIVAAHGFEHAHGRRRRRCRDRAGSAAESPRPWRRRARHAADCSRRSAGRSAPLPGACRDRRPRRARARGSGCGAGASRAAARRSRRRRGRTWSA